MTEEQRIKHNESVRAYKARNKDKVSSQSREYKAANKEAINAQNREYRAEYRAENSDHISQKQKEWRDNNPEEYKAIQRRSLEKPENREAARLRSKEYRAKIKAAKASNTSEVTIPSEAVPVNG